MRHLLTRLVDILLVIPTAFAMPLLMLLGRLRVQTRFSRKVLDSGGVAVLRRHYYEPVVFPADLKLDLAVERIIPGLDMNAVGQVAFLSSFNFSAEIEEFATKGNPASNVALAFDFQNLSFRSGDAEIYYSTIRHLKPNRIIEIGGGHSTLRATCAATWLFFPNNAVRTFVGKPAGGTGAGS